MTHVWVTEYGLIFMNPCDPMVAGLRVNPTGGFRKDKRYWLLDDFMRLLAADEWFRGHTDTDLRG